MIHIDIATLRDKATRISITRQLAAATCVLLAYEQGEKDAAESNRYLSGLTHLPIDAKEMEAYNLGWDTVRLQRGVNKNAK